MAREATIELNCICEQKSIMFLINSLCDGGWTVYNAQNQIKYLPIGDNDDFDWKEERLSYEELKNIVEDKQQKNELVGVCLYYKGTSYGIDLLLRNLQEVIVSIDINRKKIGEERDSLTDFEWYFSRIIKILNQNESFLISYKFLDYID